MDTAMSVPGEYSDVAAQTHTVTALASNGLAAAHLQGYPQGCPTRATGVPHKAKPQLSSMPRHV